MSNDVPPSTAPSRVQRPGYWQETRLPTGKTAADEEHWVYSALPGIVLSNEMIPSEHGPVVVVDPLKHLVVHADVVYVLGTLRLRGKRNVKIVARKLVFLGDAGINTDGEPGTTPLHTVADARPDMRPTAENATISGADHWSHAAPGAGGTHGKDGDHGGSGTPAGGIDICVERVEGTGLLSACGGNGHAAADGQDGQDGQSGGHGLQHSLPIGFPSSHGGGGHSTSVTANPGVGGRGGDAGRGGAGGSGGDAGLIRVRSTEPLPPTVTFTASGGRAGADGHDGSPGTGGFGGRKDTSDTGTGIPVVFEMLLLQAAPVLEGAIVGFKTLEKIGGTNTLSVFTSQALFYYNDDRWPSDHYEWKIELIHPRDDKTLRYGDQIALRNISYSGQPLIMYGDYLSTGGERNAWRLVPPTGHADGEPLPTSGKIQVSLQAQDGRYICAHSNTYPRLASPPSRADNGVVRAKPAGDDRWAAKKKGNAPPCEHSTIAYADLSKEWSPTQAWLQMERLNALVLTIELSGTQNKAFYDELADWLAIFGNPDDAFAAITARIRRIGNNLLLGLDAFGQPRDFVPNLSFVYYDKALEKKIASFGKLEKDRASLLSAVEAADTTRTDAAAAFNEATAQQGAAKEALQTALTDLAAAARTLRAATEQLNARRAPLALNKPHVKAFQDELASEFNACDMAKILDGLSMMAFCPPVSHGGAAGAAGAPAEMSGAGVLMAGVQFASYVQNGMATIKNDHGITVDKSDVLGEVAKLDATLFPSAKNPLYASAQHIYTDFDGRRSDPYAHGMLVALDQFEALLESFTRLASAKPLLDDIHALADATRARGEAIMTYNVALGRVIDLRASVKESERVIDASLAAVANHNAPELDDHLTFLARQYEEQKNAAIKLVYLANRAYAYWRLDDWTPHETGTGLGMTRNVFRDVMQAGKEGVYAAVDSQVLASCRGKLEDWFTNDLSSTPGAPTRFPKSDDIDGYPIFVRDAKVIEDFMEVRDYRDRKVHHVKIRISPDGKGKSFTNPQLKRMYDVRLTKFRVFVIGAHREATRDGDSLLRLEFLHDSRDTNYTKNGAPRSYSRPELDLRPFVYDASRKAQRYRTDEPHRFVDGFINTDGDLGCGALDDFATTGKYPLYAGIGPFTEWTIILDENANPGVTFDKDLAIEIQLLGSSRERS